MVEDFKKRGVAVDYSPDGRPIVRDAGHQKQMMAALGYVDLGLRTNNAPKNRTMLEPSRDGPPTRKKIDVEACIRNAFGLQPGQPIPAGLMSGYMVAERPQR
jgi:hypothetical protein